MTTDLSSSPSPMHHPWKQPSASGRVCEVQIHRYYLELHRNVTEGLLLVFEAVRQGVGVGVVDQAMIAVTPREFLRGGVTLTVNQQNLKCWVQRPWNCCFWPSPYPALYSRKNEINNQPLLQAQEEEVV